MNIGILGAGHIAGKMADTIRGMDDRYCCYGVASRSLDKAQAFASRFGVAHAYGSYEDMLADPSVDLVYIATPHSHHAAQAELCITHGKPVLCEKSFTATASQAEHVLILAREKRVFITEAIWTRYMPSRQIIRQIVDSGVLGRVHSIQADIGYPLGAVERLNRPELAGGALLDVGIYPINFALMAFGDTFEGVYAHAAMSAAGVDLIDSITLTWPDGRLASLHATMLTPTGRMGYIYGEDGYLAVTNINNPERIVRYDRGHNPVEEYPVPAQISGYEYEVEACRRALEAGALECPQMTHSQTLAVMRLMDTIRAQWGMKYPFE
ncbi:MAG: Gfo/Idh/MocA family protein [Clostridia bacterium]